MTDAVRLNWVGGEHDFRLRLAELRALQDRTDAGPLELLHRMQAGTWRVDDLLDTLRLGLIGGGMDSGRAAETVARVAETSPLVAFALPAQAVLLAALVDPSATDDDAEDVPPGKPTGAGSGTSPGSTAPAP